ncbi:MAG: indolepyruvate ferredoxin oxidoreductase subunit alpha [Clostridia bacterium]
MKKIMLGNEAIARGAYEAGVKISTAYPGTPSTEITEEIAKFNEIYCEWSPNEKVATEVAVGASIAGVRSMVCMKHVGLNVAADPIFTFAYTGVNGGFVLVVADDPGMHSSQNEQDSRYYAKATSIPMLEPADSAEAKDFMKMAFDISEQFDTPVFLRTTTRVSHSQSYVELAERKERETKPYVKDIAKYAMMPANAQKRHVVVEARMNKIKEFANTIAINKAEYNNTDIGVVCAGVVYQYVKEILPNASVLKLGMVNPMPDNLIKEFASKVKKLYIIEELEPIFETHIKALGIECVGKEMFSIQGEISANIIKNKFFGAPIPVADTSLPVRPPVMCAGCPHRGVFFVLSKLKLRVSADIGCYTLGAQPPLSAVDLVLCMGASIGMEHGMRKALGTEIGGKLVSVIGDSTFVHSGITGLVDAVYNKGNSTVMILDNSTTGMTGHQNNPANGKTIRDEQTHQLNLVDVAKACGVEHIQVVDAYDLQAIEKAVKEEVARDEVSVIIAKRPCVLLNKGATDKYIINQDKCKYCKACMKIGCPAIQNSNGKIVINNELCTGCALCTQMCKFDAISKEA